MSWIKIEDRKPKSQQQVVIFWRSGFKVGSYENLAGLGERVIDRDSGRFWTGFTHWKPLTKPKN